MVSIPFLRSTQSCTCWIHINTDWILYIIYYIEVQHVLYCKNYTYWQRLDKASQGRCHCWTLPDTRHQFSSLWGIDAVVQARDCRDFHAGHALLHVTVFPQRDSRGKRTAMMGLTGVPAGLFWQTGSSSELLQAFGRGSYAEQCQLQEAERAVERPAETQALGL